MGTQPKHKFKISSGLKNVIGQELITDDNVAVFELVKNSFDAGATYVKLVFENLGDPSTASITVIDNGKGMDENDIDEKWLFVAFSAKRDGTEDNDAKYKDHRTSLTAIRYAGAKGVGRFSSDRLGAKLDLFSKAKKSDRVIHLSIDWARFDKDQHIVFEKIEPKLETQKSFPNGINLNHGTVIKISELRDNGWNEKKLLALKKSLTKLINPVGGKNSRKFGIEIEAKDFLEIDKSKEEARERLNGTIENFLFENLGVKTTHVLLQTSKDGKKITTELTDGKNLIYKIEENNRYTSRLRDITISLFYLNRSAKLDFKKTMGVSSKDFGSVFVYKNGFRIYPYGERTNDPFGIDSRKQQGYSRFLGSREIIGRIEIETQDSSAFKETSSRSGGFVESQATTDLQDLFLEKVLKRLEAYVVDVQKWGRDDIDIETVKKDKIGLLKTSLVQTLAKVTDANDILKIEYGDDFLKVFKDAQTDSAANLLKNLERIAASGNDPKLVRDVGIARKNLTRLQKAKEEAETESSKLRQQVAHFNKTIEEIQTENYFLKDSRTIDYNTVISFIHAIGLSAGTISNYLESSIRKLKQDFPSNSIHGKLEVALGEVRKIIITTQYATKAGFRTKTTPQYIDIIGQTKEYLLNVKALLPGKKKINFDVKIAPLDLSFKVYTKPLELLMLVDNLVSNSERAGATEFVFQAFKKENIVYLSFRDNGGAYLRCQARRYLT
jgi:hypothetical protein